ncbi:MAG: carbon-nitrogen hydrolase family protein, partial [Burkholderiaceae bacterium]|nr:carbon-nitrogen hydrolase family protein [Burkholderiaceae bacterium]
AREEGAGGAALPENFAFMGLREADKLAVAEDDGAGPIQAALADLARELHLWIVAGTLPLRLPGDVTRTAAACLLFDAAGRRVARYDKIHLFDVAIPGKDERYQESASVAPGTTPVCVDTPAGRLGMAVCYDLRFPELYRALGPVDLILVPAAFTATTGRAHWEVLLRARAIENLCYVLAAAQGGRHENGRATYGHSMLIDPWGQVQALRGDGVGVVLGDLDPDVIARTRAELPALQHRVLA